MIVVVGLVDYFCYGLDLYFQYLGCGWGLGKVGIFLLLYCIVGVGGGGGIVDSDVLVWCSGVVVLVCWIVSVGDICCCWELGVVVCVGGWFIGCFCFWRLVLVCLGYVFCCVGDVCSVCDDQF